jgi:hypothetical protein
VTYLKIYKKKVIFVFFKSSMHFLAHAA